METNKMDQHFKRIVVESADYYAAEANKARERIWQQVQTVSMPQQRKVLLWVLTAACMLLLLALSALMVEHYQTKKVLRQEIALLQARELNAVKINNGEMPISVKTKSSIPDTITIEKEVIVYKTIQTVQQVRDTIFITDLIKAEPDFEPETIMQGEDEGVTKQSTVKVEKLLDNQVSVQPEQTGGETRKRKLQITFGGSHKQTSEGSLAFTAKL